jgi:hypothetical protein
VCGRIGPSASKDFHDCPEVRKPEGWQAGREYERKLFLAFLERLGWDDEKQKKGLILLVEGAGHDPDTQTSSPEEWHRIVEYAKTLGITDHEKKEKMH